MRKMSIVAIFVIMVGLLILLGVSSAYADEENDGFESVGFLVDKNGHLSGVDSEELMVSRRYLRIPLNEGATEIRDIYNSAKEGNRIDGRFVRTKKLHEVCVDEDGNIVKGLSFIDVKLNLESRGENLIQSVLGDAEINAQNVVNSTIIISEYEDGEYLASHKVAPGFRGPKVAELEFRDGRYLRVEIWNFDTWFGHTTQTGTPQLVLVMSRKY